MASFFDKSIEYLKGVGSVKAELLQKELRIFTYGDLIQHYPHRHEDRSKIYPIKELHEDIGSVQILGEFKRFRQAGVGNKARLIGIFADESGLIEIVWFRSIAWVKKNISVGIKYFIYGKPSLFGKNFNIAHPEIEAYIPKKELGYLTPIYPLTDKLRKRSIENKFMVTIMKNLFKEAVSYLHETLPTDLVKKYQLIDKKTALIAIHFPRTQDLLHQAKNRLKFEELFYIQLQLIKLKLARTDKFKGAILDNSDKLNEFYSDYLPFELTNAQKRVVKEVYYDLKSGSQMNRLVQGDVGSGKTMVALLAMLIAVGSEHQCAFMAPTEILADQHFKGLKEQVKGMGIHIAKLTGSTPKSERKIIHEGLMSGVISILVGTHALLEDKVQFKNLGLAVIDEQHRFGVAQRAKLWTKTKEVYPHILVMTATPIPRTLAMTLYGDLEISIIDELPAGRKPIQTKHFFDNRRLEMFGLVEREIKKGRQVYIVYPLIEESATLDYKDLMDGYESISRRFSENQISIVHGRMKPADKDFEMQRFVKGETQIMVATTVIEVGVNVPNASVMVIENAEKFGLSQLHQLRGRVGRGAEQSYCLLMTGNKLSNEGRTRISTMVATNDGFKIAEVDLNLRGPGDLMGTRQSGALDLLVSDLAKDGEILKTARIAAQDILKQDPELTLSENAPIKHHLDGLSKNAVNWGRIS